MKSQSRVCRGINSRKCNYREELIASEDPQNLSYNLSRKTDREVDWHHEWFNKNVRAWNKRRRLKLETRKFRELRFVLSRFLTLWGCDVGEKLKWKHFSSPAKKQKRFLFLIKNSMRLCCFAVDRFENNFHFLLSRRTHLWSFCTVLLAYSFIFRSLRIVYWHHMVVGCLRAAALSSLI